MAKLLIVDDSVIWQEILGKAADAKDIGIKTEIHYASTLAEALILTEKVKPDLTIMDAHLSDAGPDQVLPAIESMTPPVIMISAKRGADVRMGKSTSFQNECIRAGAEAYIEKGDEGYKAVKAMWLKILIEKDTLEKATKDESH